MSLREDINVNGEVAIEDWRAYGLGVCSTVVKVLIPELQGEREPKRGLLTRGYHSCSAICKTIFSF